MKANFEDFKKKYGNLPIAEQIQAAVLNILYRCTGKTTRTVDEMVQKIFATGDLSIVATDDLPDGTCIQEYNADSSMRKRIFENICNAFEKRMHHYHFRLDGKKYFKKKVEKRQFEGSSDWYDIAIYELPNHKEHLKELEKIRAYLKEKTTNKE